ncbi:MAG TPA: substrate-binding domain-containing protein [Opitutales bacterium]|nr:substrate-binding domain-containing protein [Opitutales bacterium]
MKRSLSLLLALGLAFGACSKSDNNAPASSSAGAAPAAGKKITIAMLPKSKGNAYFISCSDGAKKAADELGVDLLFDGPTQTDPGMQNQIVEGWIAKGVDAIAVAAENKDALSTALRKAQAQGIKVISYDADVLPDARTFFVNQATPEGIANALTDEAAKLMNNEGEFAIITASLTAANQNEWIKYIKQRLAKYPNLKLVADPLPSNDKQDEAQQQATTIMSAHPDLKLIMAICTPGVPGAAEAVKQAGKVGKVHVIGLGLPNENKDYVHQGVTDAVILWDTGKLGYLTIEAADALVKGTLKPGDKEFKVGDTVYKIDGDNILLGEPTVFDKSNIDKYNF